MSSSSVRDHEGNSFDTIQKMCKYWGMEYSTYLHRRYSGWSIEKSLTFPVNPCKSKGVACEDHLGNKFNSIQEMCKYWDISNVLYCSRIRNGWSIERALTEPVNDLRNKACEDHRGNTFSSKAEMCRYWGISYTLYCGRQKLGWSLQQILETPVLTPLKRMAHSNDDKCLEDRYVSEFRHKPCVDHVGNKFCSIQEMCRHWGIAYSLYYGRLNLGWSLKRILETPVRKEGYAESDIESKTDSEVKGMGS